MDADRRRRSRVETHFTAEFLRPGREPSPLHISNVSLKGLLAAQEPSICTGEVGLVRIVLSSEAAIEVECRVIRNNATGVAIDFLPMEEESFLHLRNLVRFNASDADQIDAELKYPAFD